MSAEDSQTDICKVN